MCLLNLCRIIWRRIGVVHAHGSPRTARDPWHVSHLAARDRRVHVVVRLADKLGVVAVHWHRIVLVVIGVLWAIVKSSILIR